MQFCIVRGIGAFVPQRIAVGPCILPAEVNLERTFPAGERDRAVRVCHLEFFHDPRQIVVPERGIFAALQDDRAEPESVTVIGGIQDLIFGQAVTLCVRIARADAAVIAVVLAEIGELDQAAEENPVSVAEEPASGRSGETAVPPGKEVCWLSCCGIGITVLTLWPEHRHTFREPSGLERPRILRRSRCGPRRKPCR